MEFPQSIVAPLGQVRQGSQDVRDFPLTVPNMFVNVGQLAHPTLTKTIQDNSLMDTSFQWSFENTRAPSQGVAETNWFRITPGLWRVRGFICLLTDFTSVPPTAGVWYSFGMKDSQNALFRFIGLYAQANVPQYASFDVTYLLPVRVGALEYQLEENTAATGVAQNAMWMMSVKVDRLV